MKTLFDPRDRDEILGRLATLQPATARQWGKMDAAQMCAHCSLALEAATGDRPSRQKLFCKILAPFFRKSLLGEKPFGRNSPTDPLLIVADPRDFEAERARLTAVIHRFGNGGPEKATNAVHAFLGPLDGAEWGRIMHKHLDHHLRQFGG